MFFERMARLVRERRSLLIAGIDPHPELLPAFTAGAALDFGLRLAEAVAEHVVGFKINTAFFEALGTEGWQALQRLRDALPPDLPVILDVKRGDVPSTARMYARAFWHTLGADAVTLSPYLGRDALEPWLQYPARGVFLLVRTSNPAAHAPQAWPLATGEPLFQALARWVAAWAAPAQVGMVVGATQPQALRAVRRAAPDFWILAPGIGAQGGTVEAAYTAGRREDGLGILFPVSRGLARAPKPQAEARRLQRTLWDLVTNQGDAPGPVSSPLEEEEKGRLARVLVETGCVRFGEFVLKSGATAPIYFDLRRLVGYPQALTQVAYAYAALLRGVPFQRLAALPYAALPLGTAVGLLFGWPVIYPRKETKPYGTRSPIEGPFEPGEAAVLLDDVLTTGLSKLEALQVLRAAGLQVRHAVVLIDREAGGRAALAREGVQVHAVFTLRELVGLWQATGLVPAEALQRVMTWLAHQGT